MSAPTYGGSFDKDFNYTPGPGRAFVMYGRERSRLPGQIAVGALGEIDGFEIINPEPLISDLFGIFVGGGGDMNGDGIDDLFVHRSGKASVIFGREAGFPPTLDLATLDGMNGFHLHAGGAAYTSAFADLNHDGLQDMVISRSASIAAVVFGRQDGVFPLVVDLDNLGAADGFTITGAGSRRVINLGDVNGDGVDDIAIGLSIVFGRSGGFPSNYSIAALNGANGFTLSGLPNNAFLSGVAAAGDLNHDGVRDLILLTSCGHFLVYGRPMNDLPAAVPLAALSASEGLMIYNGNTGQHVDDTAASVADVNGDGVNDLVLGYPVAVPGAPGPGEVFVLFGSPTLAPNALSADATGDGIVDFADLNAVLGAFGQSGPPGFSPADLNLDGIVDFQDLNLLLIVISGACP